MSVIIIESPNKKDKIEKISGFSTYATIGHFKDLPSSYYLDWDTYEPNFEFKSEEAKKRMNFIFSKCKDEEVFIATDPDREGYAIGFMFYLSIKNIAKSVKRAEFFEITESGIKKGLQNAIEFSKTNFKEYEAFKARSVGDKLVGFILSPKYIKLLKDKNVSIGRVQTPALNLIVKKEKEINAFSKLSDNEKTSYKLLAKCRCDDKEFFIESERICTDKKELDEFLDFLKNNKSVKLEKIEEKEVKKAPAKPFRTSQLQQKANSIFSYSSDETMLLAQQLFERGLITYIRTDSNSLSKEFLDEVENFYKNESWYERKEYSAGKQSQAQAHEAIRITHLHSFDEIENLIEKTNAEIKDSNIKKLTKNHTELYKLIYLNSILSQAKAKINLNKTYMFSVGLAPFKASFSQTIYKGYEEAFKESKINIDEEDIEQKEEKTQDLSFLNESSNIEILAYETKEVKKQTPARYKESSFISLLEKEGIGRPSTYASFLPTLLKRKYVELVKKGKNNEIKPTQKGMDIVKLLLENDEWITKSEYTRTMEEVLESISNNELKYLDFVRPLHQKLNFINTDESDKTLSEKQIEFLEKLCKEQGKDVPKEALQDYTLYQKTINELKKTAPKKAPSEKQIKLAQDLAQKNNLALPNDYDKDMSICSKFIDSVFKKAKK